MARQSLVVLLAIVFSLSISSSCLAKDSLATAFVRKTCNDATYIESCLNTLLPNADRINGNNKKATRLAIMATITEVQSVSNTINHYSKQPLLWTREVMSLKHCGDMIADSVMGLYDAMEATNHLGGGSKDDKESKRLSMESNVKSLVSATNTCMNGLQTSRDRDVLIKRVQETMEPLAELAINAVDLIHRLEF